MKTYRDLKQLLDGYKKNKPWYRYIIGDHPQVKSLQSMLKSASAESSNLDRPIGFGHATFLREYFEDNYSNYQRLKLGSTRKKATKKSKSDYKLMMLSLKEMTTIKKPLTTEPPKKSKKQPVEEKSEHSEEKSLSEETKKFETQIAGLSPKEQHLLRSARQKLINTQTNIPGLLAIVQISDKPDKFVDRLIHLKNLMKDVTTLKEPEKQSVWKLVLDCDDSEALVEKLITLLNMKELAPTFIKKLQKCDSSDLLTECDDRIKFFNYKLPKKTDVPPYAEFAKRAAENRKREAALQHTTKPSRKQSSGLFRSDSSAASSRESTTEDDSSAKSKNKR